MLLPVYWLINMSLKTNRDHHHAHALAARSGAGQLRQDLHRRELVFGLHPLDHLRDHQHRAVGRGRAARRLRVLALPLSRRQASVLLAADQPHGAPAVFALPFFNLYSAIGCSIRPGRSRWRIACLMSARRVDLEGFMAGVPRDRRDRGARRLSVLEILRQDLPADDASGVSVAAFFCFMFSWSSSSARTLTSVNAKPIAATMARTVSAAGMDWGTARRRRRAHHRARRS